MVNIFIKSFNRPFYLDRCLQSIEIFVEGDFFVKVLDDGEIIADNKGTEIVIKFGKFNVENISNDFKTEVSEFRNVLRESVGLLKKQGLIDKTQLEKLASQFAFLGDSKTKETKASEQESVKEAIQSHNKINSIGQSGILIKTTDL
jgi:hypothetical protein